MKSVISNFAERTLIAGSAIGSLAIWLIAGIVTYDVFLRFLGHPTLWALEISSYLMVAAAVLASGHAVFRDGHFSVGIVLDALSERKRTLLRRCINIVCACLIAFTTYGFVQLMSYTIKYDIKSPTLLRIPLYWPQSVIVTGFLLMIVGFLLKIARK